MKDKRTIKNQHDEIDERLEKLTDTEIVLEYSKLLKSIYPHLKKVSLHDYDRFDDISENLLYTFVYAAFSSKYGAIINQAEIHRYGFTLHTYHKINHIEVIPKTFPLSLIDSDGNNFELTKDKYADVEMVFIQFDAQSENSNEQNFEFTQLAIIDSKTGLYFRNQNHFQIKNELINYELVLADYDIDEHKFYKAELYAD